MPVCTSYTHSPLSTRGKDSGACPCFAHIDTQTFKVLEGELGVIVTGEKQVVTPQSGRVSIPYVYADMLCSFAHSVLERACGIRFGLLKVLSTPSLKVHSPPVSMRGPLRRNSHGRPG